MLKVRKDQHEALSQAGVGRVQACPARPGELETRKITLAQGIQFTNNDYVRNNQGFFVMPYTLKAPLTDRDANWPLSMRNRPPLAIHRIGVDRFEFTSKVQGVRFEVDIVDTRYDLKAALGAADRHVIYSGHARFGRGPCFGPNDDPGENWEDGAELPWGIYRMGFPFIGIPVSEIFEHGYTVNLASSAVSVPADQAEPTLRPFLPSLKAKTAAEIHPMLPGVAKDKDPAKTWWTYQAMEKRKVEPFVVINAGWEDTTVRPEDLGATTLGCRVFCHFGCNTQVHNRAILRDPAFKNWRRSGDDRFAFWTTGDSFSGTEVHWLYHLFTYPQYNAFCDWEPSLKYATAMTNVNIRTDGQSYQII